MERKVYLENVSVEKAKEIWFEKLNIKPSIERVDARNSKGRILSKAVFSKVSSPNYNASAMDGIAVKAKDTVEATKRNPLKISNFKYVDTGDIVEGEYNAVIMVEDINVLDDGDVLIEKSASPWQHIRTIGESIIKGQLLLPKNHKINSYDVGLLIEGGIEKINVYSKPEIGIVPTGSELTDSVKNLKKGQISEYNSYIIKNLSEDYGAVGYRNKIVKDDYELLKTKLKNEIEKRDIVVLIAGTSAGREDYSFKLIDELGEVYVHGVSMKPGGPVILGQVNQTPAIALPGYPVASALTYKIFIKPLINKLLNNNLMESKYIDAKLNTKIISDIGFEEYVRVKLSELNGDIIANPLPRKSGVISSLSEADGLIKIEESSEGLAKNHLVKVELLNDKVNPKNTLLFSGSNDLTLDILKNMLSQYDIELIINSAGSLGGIMDLSRNEVHFAGSHLLDPEDGSYNVTYINKYLKNKEVELINLVNRKSGFILPKGNPKNIRSIRDLVKDDIRFINRQRGSGTRVLFDYLLKNEEVKPKDVNGYKRVEYTHMALSSAINNDSADVGIGIYAAADAFDLEFIELVNERYDLIIPKKLLNDRRIIKTIEIINSKEFKNEVTKLIGYETYQTGNVIDYG